MDLGVRRGFSRGANEADGSVRRYVETRARMSVMEQRSVSKVEKIKHGGKIYTLMVSIQNILISVPKRKLIRNRWDLSLLSFR